MKLYHLTKDTRWLDLATYFINERGALPHYFDQEAVARGDDPGSFWAKTYEYNQSHKPVREQKKVVGHAVRAFYMFTAMADLAAELGDKSLKKACEVLWRDAVTTKMYVTGGFGPSASNEGFTADYDLPNDTAYAETCATVAMIFFSQRMLNLDLDRQYADILELGLYNGGLSGLSFDGMKYFYENRLESDDRNNRWEWLPCPCCTMNVSRLIASVGGYFYSTGKNVIAVHIYGGTTAKLKLDDLDVTLEEVSNYPWDGRIKIRISPAHDKDFTLKLRIPAWAEAKATAFVNGRAVKLATGLGKGYLAIRRMWKASDEVRLDLPMEVHRIYANAMVKSDIGKVALLHGPLLYCVEQKDNGTKPVASFVLPRNAKAKASRKSVLDGFKLLKIKGSVLPSKEWQGSLYLNQPPVEHATTITAVPYFAWNNRGPNAMRVWINEWSI